MLKKTIKYKDFNGLEKSEDLYFHVSKATVLTSSNETYNEIVKIGYDLQERSKFLEDLGKDNESLADPFSKDSQLLAEGVRMVARLLDRLVDFSYGKRSDDGIKFIRGGQVLEDFKNSAVYDAFVEQMISDQDQMVEFINQLLATN